MKSSFLKIRSGLIAATTIALITGCANVLTEMSDKESDRAKLFDAQTAIDQGNWTTALTKISQMSTTYQANRDIQVLKASAYAGRCGLNIFDIIDRMQNGGGGGSSNLFAIMMNGMRGATAANVADCLLAESTLKGISAMPSADKKENLLMALSSLTKIGAILASRGDANADGTLDWVRPGGSYPCDLATGTTALPVEDVQEIGTGFILFVVSIGAFGATGASALDAMTAFCTSPPAGTPAGICDMTDTSAFSGATAPAIAARNFIRRLVEQTDGVGLGLCAGDCMGVGVGVCDNVD